MITPLSFYKCLSEDTRLKILLLITIKGELCVCDFIDALEVSQPKVSRHLAELRKCGVLVDERRGKWVYYQLNETLPAWAITVLRETATHTPEFTGSHLNNLERAQKARACC